MPDTPLPAEEGGRPTCAYCGKFSSEMVLRADGSYTCFNQCRMASPASVVGDASEGEARTSEDGLRWIDRFASHVTTGGEYTADGVVDLCYRARAVAASLRSTRAALEEARRDSARIDWLEQQNARARVTHLLPVISGRSVRQVIDARIAPQENTKA